MPQDPQRDTDRHQPDTHPVGERNPVTRHTPMLLSIGEASATPTWEWEDPSALLSGVEVQGFMVAILVVGDFREEAEDSQEEAGLPQEEAAGVTVRGNDDRVKG